MFKPIKRDANHDAVTGVDTVGAIARQVAERTGRNGKHEPAPQEERVKGLRKIALPSYDNGGDVPEDQVAVVHQDEKVLNPEEAEQYREEKGQPELIPTQQAEVMPSTKAVAPHPAVEPSTSESTESLIQERGTPEERAAIKTDKQQAMGQGTNGFVKLGTALIHERNLEPSTSNVTAPITERPTAGLPKIAAPTQEFHQETAGGPLISGAPSTDDKSTHQDFASMERKAKLTQYDQRIQQARDAGDETTADKLTVAKAEFQKANGWGTEGNHPGILGKIGHYASEVGNIAGDIVNPNIMALIPGTKLNRAIKEGAAFNRIAPDTEAEQREASANTKESAKPKVLPGESNTAATPDGTRYQRYEMPDGSTAWAKEGEVPRTASSSPVAQSGLPQINLPTTGGLPAGAVVGKPAGESKAETREQHLNRYAELKNLAESGAQLSDQDQKEFNTLKTELTVPKATIDSYNKQIDGALHAANVDTSLWSNYHVLPGATAEEAKQAIADAKAFSGETYQQGAEGRTMDKEDRAQERKDKSTSVYAEDENGQIIKTTKYDADKRGLVAEEMKAGDINKDRQALRMLNDVQINTSRYTKAATAYASAGLTDEQKKTDRDNISKMLNKSGMYDMEASISDGGHITVPVLTAKTEAASRLARSDEYKALSREGKELYDGYVRTMAAVPAYQKALTGIGRSNKEMLDLELANIANPTMDPEDIMRKQTQFQENINQATAGFPNNLPGVKHPSQTRSETEHIYTPPTPADVIQTGTFKGQTVYKLANGSTVYKDGKPVEVK